MKFKIVLTLLIMLICNGIFAVGLNAQFSTNYQVGLGIITTNILGDNPAKLSILSSDSLNSVTGGSFPMLQPGIEFSLTIPIDEKENMRIPISIDYTLFRGKERENYNRNIVNYYSHTLNVLGINTGFHFAFMSFPVVRAKIYAGVEARFTYVHNINANKFVDYLNPNLQDHDLTIEYVTKPDVFRLGGTLKLGAEGRLVKNYYINFGFALMAANLIGRDDSRGELFTLTSAFEPKESIVYNFQIFILVQYKL